MTRRMEDLRVNKAAHKRTAKLREEREFLMRVKLHAIRAQKNQKRVCPRGDLELTLCKRHFMQYFTLLITGTTTQVVIKL